RDCHIDDVAVCGRGGERPDRFRNAVSSTKGECLDGRHVALHHTVLLDGLSSRTIWSDKQAVKRPLLREEAHVTVHARLAPKSRRLDRTNQRIADPAN